MAFLKFRNAEMEYSEWHIFREFGDFQALKPTNIWLGSTMDEIHRKKTEVSISGVARIRQKTILTAGSFAVQDIFES